MISKKKKRKELQCLRDEALQAYQNRPDFQYDANEDALFRHYKDRYTELGTAGAAGGTAGAVGSAAGAVGSGAGSAAGAVGPGV